MTISVVDKSGNSPARRPEPFIPRPEDVEALYQLITNGVATGDYFDVVAGDYVWYANASAFNAATISLQYFDLATQTWINMKDSGGTDVTATANKSVGVSFAQGARIRAAVTGGPPTGVYSNLGGI